MKIIIDLDNTISFTSQGDYGNATPNFPVIEKLREYKKQGAEIAIFTSRNMRTYQNDIGKITAHTVPVILEWLKKYEVPFDEIHVGKPWCGNDGFYVDDRAIRPDEFVKLSLKDVQKLINYEAILERNSE